MSLAQLASYGVASDEEDDDEEHKTSPKLSTERASFTDSGPEASPGSITKAALQELGGRNDAVGSPNVESNAEHATGEIFVETSQDENSNVPEITIEAENVVGFPGRVIVQRGIHITLPAEPSHQCDPEMEQKLFRTIKTKYPDGINEGIKRRKDFRNPSIYEKLIDFCKIEEKGTNFPKSMFDMRRFGPEAFYDKLAETQNKFMEKREELKNKRTNTASAPAASTSTVSSTSASMGHAVAAAASLAQQAKRNAADAKQTTALTSREASKQRTSKWDR